MGNDVLNIPGAHQTHKSFQQKSPLFVWRFDLRFLIRAGTVALDARLKPILIATSAVTLDEILKSL